MGSFSSSEVRERLTQSIARLPRDVEGQLGYKVCRDKSQVLGMPAEDASDWLSPWLEDGSDNSRSTHDEVAGNWRWALASLDYTEAVVR